MKAVKILGFTVRGKMRNTKTHFFYHVDFIVI